MNQRDRFRTPHYPAVARAQWCVRDVRARHRHRAESASSKGLKRATQARERRAAFGSVPALARYADALGLGLVVALITYLSLLIRELIPKRVALSHPERVASVVARPMQLLSRIAAPLMALLTGPTNLVRRLFGIRVSTEPSITVEEIRSLVEQGAEGGRRGRRTSDGGGVFRLGDRLVSDLMMPRTKLEWIDISAPPEVIRKQFVEQASRRSLVCEGSIDNVVGVVFAEDLLPQCLAGL